MSDITTPEPTPQAVDEGATVVIHLTQAEQADRIIALLTDLTSKQDESNRQIALSNNNIASSNDAITTLASTVEKDQKSAHRVKVWQVITIIGLVFDLTLSAGFFYNQQKANDAINKNANNAVALCIANNGTRADALKLWTKVLAVTPGDPPATVTTLQADLYLAQTIYAQRVCS